MRFRILQFCYKGRVTLLEFLHNPLLLNQFIASRALFSGFARTRVQTWQGRFHRICGNTAENAQGKMNCVRRLEETGAPFFARFRVAKIMKQLCKRSNNENLTPNTCHPERKRRILHFAQNDTHKNIRCKGKAVARFARMPRPFC